VSVDDDILAAQAGRKRNDRAATVAALERALASARADAPLHIRAVAVIHHDHTGLGAYTPAPGDVIEGTRARLYIEVANHTHAMVAAPPGLWRVQLDVSGDFAFEDEGELVKLKTVALGTQAYRTRTPAGVTSFGVELRLGDRAPAGVYRLTLKVRDALGDKSAARDARLVVVG
jgi:hypothetical protein